MAFYKANDKYSATLSSAYTVGQTTLSVNVVPDNVPTLVCVAKGTAKETIFIVTGKTVNSLTGVSRLKGYNGDLDAQMPVTCLNNEEFVNQYSTAVSTPESLIQLLYGVDGGSNDTYVVSLDVAPTAYTAGMMVAFKANTGNTGACTLNLNSLGAKSIKVDTDVDPATGDIKAGQVVLVIYDGTNFQLQTDVPATVLNDDTMASVSETIAPSSESVKSYVGNQVSAASSATPTPTGDRKRNELYLTALAEAAAFGAPSGTPVNGNTLIIRVKDNGTARALTYNAIYSGILDTLPATTTISKVLYMGFIYNSTTSKWELIAKTEQT